MITADHGNDPTWVGTDHTREQVPLLIYNNEFTDGKELNETNNFAAIGATILFNFKIKKAPHMIGDLIKEIF